MSKDIIKSVEEAFVLTNVLKSVYCASLSDGETIKSQDIINMLDLIIEKIEEIKNKV